MISLGYDGSALGEAALGEVVVNGHGHLGVVEGLDVLTFREVLDRPVDVSQHVKVRRDLSSLLVLLLLRHPVPEVDMLEGES